MIRHLFSPNYLILKNECPFLRPPRFGHIPLLVAPDGRRLSKRERDLDMGALRARFGINLHLEYYEPETLVRIIRRSAGILNVPIDDDAAVEIARRSRGTPRIANALLRRVRDFAQVRGTGRIDIAIAGMSLAALNIDRYGLDETDNKILLTIIDKFRGGPVGVSTIATAIGEDAGTVEEVYEPFLIMEGFIKRTPRGRVVTPLAYEHLGRNPYKGNIMEPHLFD